MEIAILGSGIAGVSAAIALKQKGFNVRVYERRASASNIGAGIVLWPNASYVLEQLGVLREVEVVAGRPTSMCRLTSENETLGAVDIERINRLMGYPTLSILRRDLQAILISKLESLGVVIHYGHEVNRVQTEGTKRSEVLFDNGLTISSDVLIGADGRMASRARKYVHGDNTPVYQGFINWIGVFESGEEWFPEMAVADYWGVGERFGIVPVTKYKAYWAGGVACDEIGSRNPEKYREELVSIFSKWPEPCKVMIEQTPVEWMNKIYVHDHDPIETWSKNNVLLIGDAAHAPLPTSGQGACQALEDAWHLANSLEENSGNVERAFSRFTETRSEKTAGIILAARQFAASLFSRDAAVCTARNEEARHTDYSGLAQAISMGWSKNLPLPKRRKNYCL